MTDVRRLAARRDRGTRAVEALTAALSAGAFAATGLLAAGMATPAGDVQPAPRPAEQHATTSGEPGPAGIPGPLPPARRPVAAPSQSTQARPGPGTSTTVPRGTASTAAAPVTTSTPPPPPTTAVPVPAPAPTTSGGS